MSKYGPVSNKVWAGSAASLLATLLVTYVLKGWDPTALEAVLTPLLVALGTFIAGWSVKHQVPSPGPASAPSQPPAPAGPTPPTEGT